MTAWYSLTSWEQVSLVTTQAAVGRPSDLQRLKEEWWWDVIKISKTRSVLLLLCNGVSVPHTSSQTLNCWCCPDSVPPFSWEASFALGASTPLQLQQRLHPCLLLLNCGLRNINTNSQIPEQCEVKAENVLKSILKGSNLLQVWFQPPGHLKPCRHQHEQHPPSQHRSWC